MNPFISIRNSCGNIFGDNWLRKTPRIQIYTLSSMQNPHPKNRHSRKEFVREDGSTVTIREHSLGHVKGNLGSHFNVEVRPLGGGASQPLLNGADSHVFYGP
jgi:hypothetical protein